MLLYFEFFFFFIWHLKNKNPFDKWNCIFWVLKWKKKCQKKEREKWCPHPNFAQEDKKKLLTMEFHMNWNFFIIIIHWQFQHKLYFSNENSKLINHSMNIWWSCQDTIVACYVFTTASIYKGRLFVCFVVLRSTKLGASDRVLDVVGKLLMRRGAWAWFHGVFWTGHAKAL